MSRGSNLRLAAAVVVALGFAASTRAEEAAGDWLGTLKTRQFGDLTMALHLHRAAAGYEGTLDDIELGVRGMVLTGVEASGDHLTFDIPAARARYDATWDPAAGQWAGTWTSGTTTGLPLRLARGLPAPAPRVEGLDGDWQGAINAGAAGLLRLVFHIRTGSDGTQVTVDSPDQGVMGAPVTGVRRTGRDIDIDMRALQARFVGELWDDGSAVQGEFTQGPTLAPIILKRTSDAPLGQVSAPAPSPPPKTWSIPDDAAIRQVLVRRIDTERRGVGIVVGVISPKGRRVVAYGSSDIGDRRSVDADTLFEIGSISKTFTALVLQDMALRGEVGLDDPVSKYLPAGVKVPSRGGKVITLRELAMHTAALPHDLPNLAAKRQDEMLAGTSEADLYKFLASYQLPRDPGTEWEYSNLGVGLLGIALSHRAGVDLETLIRQRVTGPLGMTSTVMTVTPELKSRLATGHDAFLRPEPPLDIGPAEAAAGQIRSSANDMLKLLAAEMDYTKTPLRPAMDAMLATERAGMQGGFRQALGWMILEMPSGRLVTHSGGTFGHRAFTAFNPKMREGVIVLSNAEGANGADDIGLYVIAGVPIRPLPPAPPPPAARSARADLPITAAAAKPYLGRYRLSRSIFMTIGYNADHMTLLVEARGMAGPPLPIASHGGNDFSAPNGGGDVGDMTFQLGASGRASGFIWRGPAGEFRLGRDDQASP
ncbi:serine hydrolase domain-containing protein [Phenylobacterium sp.]|jgi:CubicO group peptidase (beta-lactamase class C family)|uniref:serine hydrolase domain-containing protein n=1 Tax=Phenylobacterium sp. TaxID=1871053 RepID=UPI002F3EAE6F